MAYLGEKLLMHKCTGGKYPGTIRRYPKELCSLCNGLKNTTENFEMTDDEMRAENEITVKLAEFRKTLCIPQE